MDQFSVKITRRTGSLPSGNQHLFFLLIIVPVIVLFLLVYGLFSNWAYARTGHPFVGGIASFVAFAWAIAVTFPLLAG